jgi:hypothetical protein
MTTERRDPNTPNQPTIPALTPQESEDLRRARELRRIIGDPRVRVEVPTGSDANERPVIPTSRRYQIG